MRPDVPLVVPEVNGATLEQARTTRVIANPNCTTAQMVMALKPLHDRFRVKRVILASYQAVSGKGQKGIDEFERQVREYAAGKPPTVEAFPHPIAFNALPHIDVFRPDGFTGEEHKVMEETRKIMGDPSIRVVATCVRVPVLNCHSESVTIETEREVSPETAREALRAMPGVKVVDEPSRNEYPLAMNVSGKDEVYVGRIRRDPSLAEGQHGLTFWVVGDNLRKGAALNAVQISEAAIERGLIKI
jgi:aspartate-semialdehyde dehydrogenase